MDAISPGADNRRAVLRTGTFEILKALRSFAQLHGGDMFALLVFTTIWSANGENLLGDERYAGLHRIGPDKGSLPMTDAALQMAIGAPAEIVARYVDAFLALGIVERVQGGLVAPAAVFTSPEMMDAAVEFYDRIQGLGRALKGVGFDLIEETAPSPLRA
jgi:hypothetical protein